MIEEYREKIINKHFWLLRNRLRDSSEVSNRSKSACNRRQSERFCRYSFKSSAKMNSLGLMMTEVAEFTKRAKRNGDRTALWEI